MNKKLELLLLYITLSIPVCSFAIPAKPVIKELTLEDGTIIMATLMGDEFGHWFQTDKGEMLKLQNNGKAKYLNAQERTLLRETRLQRFEEANQQRVARLSNARTSSTQKTSTYTGSKKGLVILVNFSDRKMSSKGTSTEFNNMFNKVGYSNNNHAGSVHDYFSDNSYGQFNLSFDVVGPVTVSKNISYYGGNSAGGNDKYPATMVIEACKLVDKSVNFSNYDWDKDGYVDQVFIIYAGYGENAGADANTIWPHAWNLYSANYYGDGTGELKLDGVKVNRYACTCELGGSGGSTLAGIGTACHEFSHCLGYPDTYDTQYSGGPGMMNWDLMCAGGYNGYHGIGERPVGFTAYEKWMGGWITPTELNTSTYIKNMPCVEDNKNAIYVIYNSTNRSEFYLLENRQDSKWNYYQSGNYMGHGLLISHIDYNATAWSNNTVNNKVSHQRVTYFPADNIYGTKYTSGSLAQIIGSLSDYRGDTYPGTSGNTKLTDSSTPRASLFNGNSTMGKPITEIKESNGLISFSFMGGKDSEGGSGSGSETQSVSIISSITLGIGESTHVAPVLSPSNFSSSFTWTSTNPEIATVANGVIKGITEGTTTVYCTSDNGIKSNNCIVTVTNLVANSISIVPSYLYLPIGQKKQMEYTLSPWNANTTITWKVEVGEAVVSIDDLGLLTALSAGSAMVSVQTSNKKYDHCQVVVPPTITSISLPANLSLGMGQSIDLPLKVVPEDAYLAASWSSSNSNIVSVSNTGKITAVNTGTATISVQTEDGFSANTEIQVYEPSYYFIVIFRNKSNFRYEIKERPTLTHSEGELVFSTPFSTQAYPEESIWKMMIVDYHQIEQLGDINGDGEIDIADVTALIQLWKEHQESQQDINFDGVLDFKDLEALKEMILGQDK